MADRNAPLNLEALNRALAEPAGLPLYALKGETGLFPLTAPGRRAAQTCIEAGYLQTLRTETRGKTSIEICAITDHGVEYLRQQQSPRQVLEACLHAIDQRGFEMVELLTLTRRCQQTLESLKAHVGKVLAELPDVDPPALQKRAETAGWQTETLTQLSDWQRSHGHEDCPLPELYERARQRTPDLTLGQFQDGLRALHERGRIYLYPWTGPLHEIPDPSVALLVGHAVVFYASLREDRLRASA
jgi:hypothetical protein